MTVANAYRDMTEAEIVSLVVEHTEAVAHDLLVQSGFQDREAGSLAARIAAEARRVLVKHLGIEEELTAGFNELVKESA